MYWGGFMQGVKQVCYYTSPEVDAKEDVRFSDDVVCLWCSGRYYRG